MRDYKQQWRALGSLADVTLASDSPSAAEYAYGVIKEAIKQFEARFSRFKHDSELTAFNERAGAQVAVSPEFMAVLTACRQYMALTNGIFNPFILPALQSAGYRGSWPATQAADDRLDVRDRHIAAPDQLNLQGNIAMIPAGTAMDFGGIGKGYMLDILSNVMQQLGTQNYCISLGGDIIWQGNSHDGKPWRIGIARATNESNAIGTISASDSGQWAVASSTVVKRKGDGWHHLIDPRTGVSSDSSVLMSTVIANSGAAADVLAKTFLIDPTAVLAGPAAADSVQGLFLQYKDGSSAVVRDTGGFFTV